LTAFCRWFPFVANPSAVRFITQQQFSKLKVTDKIVRGIPVSDVKHVAMNLQASGVVSHWKNSDELVGLGARTEWKHEEEDFHLQSESACKAQRR
jgi:hypothetical protein